MEKITRIGILTRAIPYVAETFKGIHYVVPSPIMNMIPEGYEVHRDHCVLPHHSICIEEQIVGDGDRHLVTGSVFCFVRAGAPGYDFNVSIGMVMTYLDQPFFLGEFGINMIYDGNDIFRTHKITALMENDTAARENTEVLKMSVGGLGRFMFLQATKGLAEERVEAPAKLNKKRIAKGTPAIQPYIRVVVGQVYDHEGNEIPEHERRHVRPHIRAGHSRRQHHGPQNSLLKTVHIPSTVVNYGAGDTLPDRPRVFVPAKEKRHVMALGESIH